jgi:hypothetical protein
MLPRPLSTRLPRRDVSRSSYPASCMDCPTEPTYRLTADAASTSLSLYVRRRASEGFDLQLPHSTSHLERITRFLVGGGYDAGRNPYGVGESRVSNCSMLEAVRLRKEMAVRESNRSYSESKHREPHLVSAA